MASRMTVDLKFQWKSLIEKKEYCMVTLQKMYESKRSKSLKESKLIRNKVTQLKNQEERELLCDLTLKLTLKL